MLTHAWQRCAAAVLAVALAAACTGSGAEVPDGWTTVELDGLRFAHPPDWTVVDDDDDGVWTFMVLDADREEATIELRATPWLGAHRSAADGTAQLHVGFRVGVTGYETDARADVDVAGAGSAEQTRFHYLAEGEMTVHGVWIVAADEDGQRTAALQLTAVEEPDEELVEQVAASMELTEVEQPPEEPADEEAHDA